MFFETAAFRILVFLIFVLAAIVGIIWLFILCIKKRKQWKYWWTGNLAIAVFLAMIIGAFLIYDHTPKVVTAGDISFEFTVSGVHLIMPDTYQFVSSKSKEEVYKAFSQQYPDAKQITEDRWEVKINGEVYCLWSWMDGMQQCYTIGPKPPLTTWTPDFTTEEPTPT